VSREKIPSPLWGEGRGEGEMKRNNIARCRNLRKNQTDAETKLWTILRNRQIAEQNSEDNFLLVDIYWISILQNTDLVLKPMVEVIMKRR